MVYGFVVHSPAVGESQSRSTEEQAQHDTRSATMFAVYLTSVSFDLDMQMGCAMGVRLQHVTSPESKSPPQTPSARAPCSTLDVVHPY